MNDKKESPRWGRVFAIIIGAGLLVIVPLAWWVNRMADSSRLRARVMANESTAIDTVDLIAAAQRIHLEAFGRYGGIQELKDAGILNVEFAGEPPAYEGYAFTVKLAPSADGSAAGGFSVNADPVVAAGDDATGQRHFYLDSETSGIRYHESRPATPADKALARSSPL